MKSGEVTYARPGPAAADAIARLHVESWRETYEGIIPPNILADADLADRTARWHSYLAVGGYPTFLASVAGQPAGIIRAGPLPEPLAEGADGHIYVIYILQRFHRRGIGRKLVGLVAAEWLQLGGSAFSVGVLSANHGARAFYEAIGARYIRPDIYQWQGHSLPESIYLFENLTELARFA